MIRRFFKRKKGFPKAGTKRADAGWENEKAAMQYDSTAVQNRALSVRQPFAEQILCGTKRIEYRSVPTNIRGRVYIYASQKSDPCTDTHDLPKGVIVGTVVITDCIGKKGDYEWYLAEPIRLPIPIKPETHPQPVWFKPFLRDDPEIER